MLLFEVWNKLGNKLIFGIKNDDFFISKRIPDRFAYLHALEMALPPAAINRSLQEFILMK